MKYDTDGAILVSINDGAGPIGLFTPEGYLRLNTTGDTATGLVSPDGEWYAEISSDDTPASGTGRYNPKGWVRCSDEDSDFFGSTGLYGTDQSIRIRVPA